MKRKWILLTVLAVLVIVGIKAWAAQQTLVAGDTWGETRTKINSNDGELYDHANTTTGNPHSVTASDVSLGNVSNVATDDTAYNATSWDGNNDAATKNAVRDKFELGGVGEANTASSLGGDETIVGTKSGVDLRFKGLSAGSRITLVGGSTEVTVSADAEVDPNVDTSTEIVTIINTSPSTLIAEPTIATEMTRDTELSAHTGADGSSHMFIDQSVIGGSSPTLDGNNFTGMDANDVDIADAGAIITATDAEGALQENRTALNLNTTHRGNNGSDHSFIDQSVVIGASPDLNGENITNVVNVVNQDISRADGETVTPTAAEQTNIDLTCTETAALKFGEGNATHGDIAIVVNISAEECSFVNEANVLVTGCDDGVPVVLNQDDTIMAQYQTDKWVLIGNESSTLCMDSIGVGIYKELEVNAVDGTYDGVVITRTVDSGAISLFGQALHVDTDGEMIVADADVASAGSMPALCLAVEAGTGSKKCLLRGTITETDWNWTIGAFIYIDDDPTENEGLTEVAGIPATTGDQVQVVGIALTADTIYVDMGGLVLVEVP